MNKIKSFRDLLVWQKAHLLTLAVYQETKKFPSDEKFGLTSQLRRSVSSVPTNIVEGYARNGSKEFGHFLNIARGSVEETKYHLILAKDLGYLSEEKFQALFSLCDEAGRMLFALQTKVRAPKASSSN